MTAGFLRLTILPVTCAALLLLTACGTTAPTRFYILNPVTDTDTSSPAAKNNHISIALASVTLPEHLNRPQIVTRQGGHQVRVDEYNRWAEPLEAHVTTILAENLSLILGTDRISITNRFKNSDFDYQLSVNVLRFDGWPGKEATLVCRWELGRGEESAESPPQRFSATRPVEGDDYRDLVAVLSSMLADLGREIADQILSY